MNPEIITYLRHGVLGRHHPDIGFLAGPRERSRDTERLRSFPFTRSPEVSVASEMALTREDGCEKENAVEPLQRVIFAMLTKARGKQASIDERPELRLTLALQRMSHQLNRV